MGWERRTDKKWKWKNPFVHQIQFSGNDSVMLGWKATGVWCSWSWHHQAGQWEEVDRKVTGSEVQTLRGVGGNKADAGVESVTVLSHVTKGQVGWEWWQGGLEDGLCIKRREASYVFPSQTDSECRASFHFYLNNQCLQRGELLSPICRSKEINFKELNEWGFLVCWHKSSCVGIVHVLYKKDHQ